jgi:hypothetical protein
VTAEKSGKSLRHRGFRSGIEIASIEPKNRPFGPLQAREALLYAARANDYFALFLGSSAVEHSTVNRMVAGSNPARGANKNKDLERDF